MRGRRVVTIDALDALRPLGVHLGIDDFGTGYSSLATCERFPVDASRSTGRSSTGSAPTSEDPRIVAAIVDAGARARARAVVAEGVETPSPARRSSARSAATTPQGYLFAPARMPADVMRPPGRRAVLADASAPPDAGHAAGPRIGLTITE